MTATVLAPLKVALTGSMQAVGSAVTSGKVQNVTLRVTNVHATDDAYFNLELYDGTNSLERYKNYPVPNKALSSAPDVEINVPIPAGWNFRASADNTGKLVITRTGLEMDATDIA